MSPPERTQTTLVQLGDASYYVRNRVEARLPQEAEVLAESGPVPTTVINATPEFGHVSLELIQTALARFAKEDDVFQPHFTSDGGYIVVYLRSPLVDLGNARSGILLLDAFLQEQMDKDLTDYLKEQALELFVVVGSHPLPDGPYFTLGRDLHQAWRLYSDHLSAFTTPVLPDDRACEHCAHDGQFVVAPWSQPVGQGGMIAVPSRLYFKKSTLPLAGVRVSVKDNMHLAGVPTSLGNKAYTELYGNQPENASVLQKLLDEGAVIVGKTKLSAFSGSEIPPADCIDYFPPWNPRGDGYQGPSGSSSGAAASVAGYEWLDAGIAFDTFGGIRHPATAHGVWGHKLTWDGVSMHGVVPCCKAFDCIGILSRSPKTIEDVVAALDVGQDAPTPTDDKERPIKILFPTDWYPLESPEIQKFTEEFLQDLEKFASVQHTKISIEEEWRRSGPEEFRGMRLDAFLAKSRIDLSFYDCLHNFDQFRKEYTEKFGKKPYVSPFHSEHWDESATITAEDRLKGLRRVPVFRRWALENLLQSKDGSRVIMLIPHGRAGPSYRDALERTSFGLPTGPAGPAPITSHMGVPQVIVPIGENPYKSRVSGQKEYVPIFTTLIGAPGSDIELLQLARKTLEAAGKPTELLTGRTMFPH